MVIGKKNHVFTYFLIFSKEGNEKSSDEKLLESENNKNSLYFEESEPKLESSDRKTTMNSIRQTMMVTKMSKLSSQIFSLILRIFF